MVSKSFCFFIQNEAVLTREVKGNLMNMKQIGIDVSKATLDCCFLIEKTSKDYQRKEVDNTLVGFKKLKSWILKITKALPGDIQITLEATGVYHLKLTQFLNKMGFRICVVNPADSFHYAKSLGMRAKTDKLDGIMLAHYGWERRLRVWRPAPKKRIEIKALSSRLSVIEKDIRREQNRLESIQIAGESKAVERLIKTAIKSLEKQKQQCEKLIDQLIDSDQTLVKDKELLLSIKGIGIVCTRHLLGEIYIGRFKSATQCAAFMGLVPVPKQSGTVHQVGLSKGGNRALKAKLYMAAISAKRYNPLVKNKYDQLIARGKSKMSALCAAMQHLIRICFGVIKHQKEFCLQVN